MNQNREEIQSLQLEKAKNNLVNAVEIQEAERARIGLDIHDDIGPSLSIIKLIINSLDSSEKNIPKIEKLKLVVEDTIKSVRGISHSLYPSTLEKYGLVNALNDMSFNIKNKDINQVCTISPKIDSLSFYEKINIYRIIQEFCNNSLKYSQCTEINLHISESDGVFEICISDNGVGFDYNSEDSNGIGIRNIKMRAEAIEFNLKFSSKVDYGTSIVLDNSK